MVSLGQPAVHLGGEDHTIAAVFFRLELKLIFHTTSSNEAISELYQRELFLVKFQKNSLIC